MARTKGKGGTRKRVPTGRTTTRKRPANGATKGAAKRSAVRNAQSALYVSHSTSFLEAAVAEMEARTGRPLDAWVELLRREGPKGDKRAQRTWLTDQHRLGMTAAGLIVEHAAGGSVSSDPEALVARMFAGRRSGLRPAYDRLLSLGKSLAPDVTAVAGAMAVALHRRRAFAQLTPASDDRIDLGLVLAGCVEELPPRLEPLDGAREKWDRLTHRLAITSVDDIDADVEKWLWMAYELDAG